MIQGSSNSNEPNPYAAPSEAEAKSDARADRPLFGVRHPWRHLVYACLWFVVAFMLGGALSIGGSREEAFLDGLLLMSGVTYFAVAIVLSVVSLLRRQ